MEEAEKREQRYDNGVNYLFDLDYYEDHSEFTIDATKYGNVAHFFNHSVSCVLFIYLCANQLSTHFPGRYVLINCLHIFLAVSHPNNIQLTGYYFIDALI